MGSCIDPVGSQVSDPSGVDVGVQSVEDDGEERDEERHRPARGAHSNGEDERPVQVVELPQTQEHEGDQLEAMVAGEEEHGEERDCR